MKVECSLDRLKTMVPVVDKVTGKNLTLQILSSILIIANGKTLKLRATNLDIGIEVEIPAKIEKEGVAAVRGATFNSLLSAIQNEKTVVLESINDNISISTQSTNATIKCYPPTDFPTIPLITNSNNFLISVDKFISGINSVFYSASLSDIKPEISSVYIYPEDNELVFVSTDSFRLAEKKIKIRNTPDFNGFIIPFKNAIEIAHVLSLFTGEVKIFYTKNQISFSGDGVYFTSRLIDGLFPDYRQIIPKEVTTELVVLKQDIINALKINNVFLDKFNQITINIKPKSKIFSINSQSGELGETTTQIQAVLKGDDVVVHVNYRYLFDVFQSITSDSVCFLLNGVSKPVIIKGISDESFRYLVMPLNR